MKRYIRFIFALITFLLNIFAAYIDAFAGNLYLVSCVFIPSLVLGVIIVRKAKKQSLSRELGFGFLYGALAALVYCIGFVIKNKQ